MNMKITIILDGKCSKSEIIDYINSLKIDDELIKSITFDNSDTDEDY